MSALGLPALERRLVARHFNEQRRRWRRSIFALTVAFLGAYALGLATPNIVRISSVGWPRTVTLTDQEIRALDLLRPAGFAWALSFTSDEVRVRLNASRQAIELADLLDKLPGASAGDTPGWFTSGSHGHIGNTDAIVTLAGTIAVTPPDQRNVVANLFADLGRAPSETWELVLWLAQMPADERKVLRALRTGALATTAGREALLTLSTLRPDQIVQCRDAAQLRQDDWAKLATWTHANSVQLAAFRALADLPADDLSNLATIATLAPSPSERRKGPFPCLDAATDRGWSRAGHPIFTCTVVLN